MTLFRVLTLASCLVALAPAVHSDESRWRDCRTCHMVEAPDGRELARGGRSGPNLYGIANRVLAGDSGFRFYSAALRAAGQTGARWSEDNFVAYLAGPDQFLRAVTGNPDAQSEMHVELRSGGRELFRWLQTLD